MIIYIAFYQKLYIYVFINNFSKKYLSSFKLYYTVSSCRILTILSINFFTLFYIFLKKEIAKQKDFLNNDNKNPSIISLCKALLLYV